MKNKLRPGLLAFSVAIPLCIGGLSAMVSGDMVKEYNAMSKPALSPPGWMFPVVWTILYLMMGIAAYLILDSDADVSAISKALTFYGIQLVLNFFWSILFFNRALYLWALAELLLMWVIIIITAVQFFRIRKTAGLLLIPYAAWTSFAAYLNFAVYKMSIAGTPPAV